LQRTHPTATMPAKFTATATPRLYPKTGRRSFFIDESGEIRGAEKNGATANAGDPPIVFDADTNERKAILALRTLSSAQETYKATIGNGNYAPSLYDLHLAGLIGPNLASGVYYSYGFTTLTVEQTPKTPAIFKIWATPINYGQSGFRSFFIDTTGVIRGADHQGGFANENDPPVSN
jgi:hypothetical protein